VGIYRHERLEDQKGYLAGFEKLDIEQNRYISEYYSIPWNLKF